jgi:hypothetical protein
MVSKVRGRFTSYDATIVTCEDPLGSSVADPGRLPHIGSQVRRPEQR